MKKSLGFAALSAGAMLAGSGIASAQEAPPPPHPALSHPHSVLAGESLSTIALAELGTPDRWVEIFALNHTALASPEVVRVGQVLDIPSPPVAVAVAVPVPEAVPPSDQPPARPYTVLPGESLSTISQTELGAADRWVEIFALNRDALPDPQVIEVGRVLNIPLAPVAIPADLLASLAPAPVRAPASSRPAAATAAVAAATAPQAVRTTGSSGGGGNLSAIRACESSGNYGAVSGDGLYRGAYQFDLQTWQSVGGSGDPAAASASEQDSRATQLLSQRGSNPWPNCG